MRQSVLDRSVARITGEPVSLIRSMGFSLIVPPAPPLLNSLGQNRRRRSRTNGWHRSRRLKQAA